MPYQCDIFMYVYVCIRVYAYKDARVWCAVIRMYVCVFDAHLNTHTIHSSCSCKQHTHAHPRTRTYTRTLKNEADAIRWASAGRRGRRTGARHRPGRRHLGVGPAKWRFLMSFLSRLRPLANAARFLLSRGGGWLGKNRRRKRDVIALWTGARSTGCNS